LAASGEAAGYRGKAGGEALAVVQINSMEVAAAARRSWGLVREEKGGRLNL